ncbi:hypothetical protein [Streptomyces cinereospinus]|uniref:Uncharacterized protein n=1 Tax=Streptomyces cinereospinus TaxID=285561 RepID=A0ABV5N501_9ACTN
MLSGTFPPERVNRDARLFGLVSPARHVAVAARAVTTDDSGVIRRAVAATGHVPADRLPLAQVGTALGSIAPRTPKTVADRLVAVSPPLPLDQLHVGFVEAVLVLESATRFAMPGVVRLSDLGPRSLVRSDARTAEGLSVRHLAPLDDARRSSGEIEETAVRFWLLMDCPAEREPDGACRHRAGRLPRATGPRVVAARRQQPAGGHREAGRSGTSQASCASGRKGNGGCGGRRPTGSLLGPERSKRGMAAAGIPA